MTPGQVAGYLAKYATKSATETGATDNPHHRRLRATARQLTARAQAADQADGGEAGPYLLLGKWVHMLGFRGHFASKSRRYSITLSALRRARRRAQALIAEACDTGRPLDLAALEADLLAGDDTDTTLVIGHWTYAGTGWATEGQRVLANAAAARASTTSGRQSSEGQRRTREKGQGDEEGICRADPDGWAVHDADLVGGGAAAGSGPVNPVQGGALRARGRACTGWEWLPRATARTTCWSGSSG